MTALSLYFRPEGVAVLTFDQPGSKANVLIDRVWAEFEEALDILAKRTEVKGLVLTSGKPNIFIAGADLKLLGDAPGPNDPAVRAFIDRGNRTLFKLEALPIPTCAAVDGVALGGGCEVALACDYRVCGSSPRVSFGLPEVNLGLTPGWGGSQRLPRLVGVPDALAAMHSGGSIANNTLSDRVATSDQLLEAAAVLVKGSDWKSRRQSRQSPLPADRRMASDFYDNVRTAIPQMPEKSVAARLADLDLVYRGGSVSLAEAVAFETDAFMSLAGGEESKRLIAEFFAARKK